MDKKFHITLIAAMDKNRVIGNKGTLPNWKAPGDLKRFKDLTLNKLVLMGRNTWESLPGGTGLSNRVNMVLSTSMKELPLDGPFIANSITMALSKIIDLGMQDKILVIGGGEIYKQTIEMADVLEITKVNGEFEGTVYFPEINPKLWTVTETTDIFLNFSNKKQLLNHQYITYKRP